MKKIQNIAFIALFALMITPQTMVCIDEAVEPTSEPTYDPSDRTSEKIIDQRSRFEQFKDYLREKFNNLFGRPTRATTISQGSARNDQTDKVPSDTKPKGVRISFTRSNKPEEEYNPERAQRIADNQSLLKAQIQNFLEETKLHVNNDILKLVMKTLTASQKAQLLTEIVQEQIKDQNMNASQAMSKFHKYLRRINTILPKTDLLMSTYADPKNLKSFRFQIADMSEFTYDNTKTLEQNVTALAQSQGLKIRTQDLTYSMLDYYKNNNETLYKQILKQEIIRNSNNPEKLASIIRNAIKLANSLTNNQFIQITINRVIENYQHFIRITSKKPNQEEKLKNIDTATTNLVDIITNPEWDGAFQVSNPTPKKS